MLQCVSDKHQTYEWMWVVNLQVVSQYTAEYIKYIWGIGTRHELVPIEMQSVMRLRPATRKYYIVGLMQKYDFTVVSGMICYDTHASNKLDCIPSP